MRFVPRRSADGDGLRPDVIPRQSGVSARGSRTPAGAHRETVLGARGGGDARIVDEPLRGGHPLIRPAGYADPVVSRGDDNQHVRVRRHEAVNVERSVRVPGVGEGSPTVVVDPCTFVVRLLEEIADIVRDPPEAAVGIENRLDEDLRLRSRAENFPLQSGPVPDGASRDVRAVPFRVGDVLGVSSSPGARPDDPVLQIGVFHVDASVGHSNNLAGPLKPDLLRLADQPQQRSGRFVVQLRGLDWFNHGHLGPGGQVEQYLGILYQGELHLVAALPERLS